MRVSTTNMLTVEKRAYIRVMTSADMSNLTNETLSDLVEGWSRDLTRFTDLAETCKTQSQREWWRQRVRETTRFLESVQTEMRKRRR